MIISNNPMVWAAYEDLVKIEGSIIAVMEKARDLIHIGHKLVSHPLAGSVKPNQTPYKSLIVSDEAQVLDFTSLEIIENALSTSQKMLKDNPLPQWPEDILVDLQLIDKDLLDSAFIP